MSLLNNFKKIRNEKLKLADSYEEEKSFEMAFVALWSVTEHTVKEIEELRKNKELSEKILAWHNFFIDDSITKRPAPIKSFACEVKAIPEIKLIQESLGAISAISKLLQTKKNGKSSKYRDKRNAIAHSAEAFKNADVYLDYKETALSAILELESKLQEMEG